MWSMTTPSAATKSSGGRFGVQSESYPALSTLKPVAAAQETPESRRAEPAQTEAKPASQGWNFSRPSSPPPAAVNEEIKRVMAPFKDTHFTRMSGGPAPAAPTAIAAPVQAPTPVAPAPVAPAPVVEAQKPAPAPTPEPSRVVDFGAIIPGRFDRPKLPSPRPHRRARSRSRPALEPSMGSGSRPRHRQQPSRWRPAHSNQPSRPPNRRLFRITTKSCRCRRRSHSFRRKCRTPLLMQMVSRRVRSRTRRQSCCAPCCVLGFPTTCRAWSKRRCTSRWPRVSGRERSRPTRQSDASLQVNAAVSKSSTRTGREGSSRMRRTHHLQRHLIGLPRKSLG